jgi:hypothetical protein
MIASAQGLLAHLRRRGIEVFADGAALRWRAPRGVVTPTDLEALRARKREVLEVLRSAGDDQLRLRLVPEPAATPLDRFLTDASVPVAIFHSRRLGRAFVLARDEKALGVLTEADRALPVLFFADCETLSGLGPADLAKILDARQVFGPSASLAVEARLG